MTSDELRARREALGLSQSDLARALDVPRQHVYRWETGTYKVPPLMEMAMRGVAATVLLDLSDAEWIDLSRLWELADSAKRRRRRRRAPASHRSSRTSADQPHQAARTSDTTAR